MSPKRTQSSRNRGIRRHGGKGTRKRARRLAFAAFSPATTLAVLVMAGVMLAIWSCSTFDAGTSRRRPPAPAGGTDPAAPSAPVAALALYTAEPDIRVRVKTAVDSARIDPVVPLVVSGGAVASAPIPGPVVVSNGPGGVRLTTTDGQTLQFAQGTVVTLSTAHHAAASAGFAAPVAGIRVDGTDFPGQIVIRPASDVGPTKFDVIADMSIEDYLPGVLAKELFAKWPQAAFEAQAVCARTYALFVREQDRAAGRPFDVENSQADQVFGGATDNLTALRAVRATRGVVLTYGGGLFKAYYSSTCGGRAGSAADVWPTSKGFEYNLAAPIQASARESFCQQARLYRWDVTRTGDDLGKRMAAWGKSSGHPVRAIGSVRGVVVERVNQTSRPSRFAVQDDRGRTFSLSAEELRVACNTSADGLPAVTPQTRMNSGDVEFVPVGGATTPTFTVHGRGFGHGVGMCQWCLKGLADKGVPWDQQVLMFYPGAKVVQAYH